MKSHNILASGLMFVMSVPLVAFAGCVAETSVPSASSAAMTNEDDGEGSGTKVDGQKSGQGSGDRGSE